MLWVSLEARSQFSNSEQPRCMLIISCFSPVCSEDYDNTWLFWRRSLQGLDERVTLVTTSLSLCFRLRGTASSQDNCHLLFWTQRARRILNSAFQFMIKNMCYGGRHQSCGGHCSGDLPNISGAHGINAICFTLHFEADRRVSRCCWFFNVWHAQGEHLVTAPVDYFAMCFCLLACDSRSTLLELRCGNVFVGQGPPHLGVIRNAFTETLRSLFGSLLRRVHLVERKKNPTFNLKKLYCPHFQCARPLAMLTVPTPGDLFVPMPTLANHPQDTWARCIMSALDSVHGRQKSWYPHSSQAVTTARCQKNQLNRVGQLEVAGNRPPPSSKEAITSRASVQPYIFTLSTPVKQQEGPRILKFT